MHKKLHLTAYSLTLAGVLSVSALIQKPAHSASPAAAAPVQKKTYPAQSSVAAKAVFGLVPASSPDVKKAIAAKDIAGAQKLVGKPTVFQGTVSKVFAAKGNSHVILDFDPDYQSAVTAVAMPEAYAKLPDLKTLEGKHILVSGTFVVFHGAPQIVLTLPTQIKIIH